MEDAMGEGELAIGPGRRSDPSFRLAHPRVCPYTGDVGGVLIGIHPRRSIVRASILEEAAG